MRSFFLDPNFTVYLIDTLLAVAIYGFSIALFLKYKKDFMVPLLFFGLFLFPLQFSIWYLQPRITLVLPSKMNLLDVVYLLALKVSLLVTVLLIRR
jgi:hypothetical protein